ncbi:hypothetical protein CSG_16960 [Campylobacter fetus subsp. venerealis str. 84-112]|nr:hypothetical protein CSG_16960 [Campylobacter fetus subsp. venerealis str. 84-112]
MQTSTKNDLKIINKLLKNSKNRFFEINLVFLNVLYNM